MNHRERRGVGVVTVRVRVSVGDVDAMVKMVMLVMMMMIDDMMRNPRTRSDARINTRSRETFSLYLPLSLSRSVLRCSPFRNKCHRKREEREREMRGLICEGVESGSFQMDFKRKARRADDDEGERDEMFLLVSRYY